MWMSVDGMQQQRFKLQILHNYAIIPEDVVFERVDVALKAQC